MTCETCGTEYELESACPQCAALEVEVEEVPATRTGLVAYFGAGLALLTQLLIFFPYGTQAQPEAMSFAARQWNLASAIKSFFEAGGWSADPSRSLKFLIVDDMVLIALTYSSIVLVLVTVLFSFLAKNVRVLAIVLSIASIAQVLLVLGSAALSASYTIEVMGQGNFTEGFLWAAGISPFEGALVFNTIGLPLLTAVAGVLLFAGSPKRPAPMVDLATATATETTATTESDTE